MVKGKSITVASTSSCGCLRSVEKRPFANVFLNTCS